MKLKCVVADEFGHVVTYFFDFYRQYVKCWIEV